MTYIFNSCLRLFLKQSDIDSVLTVPLNLENKFLIKITCEKFEQNWKAKKNLEHSRTSLTLFFEKLNSLNILYWTL